jgi:hypothetical protein
MSYEPYTVIESKKTTEGSLYFVKCNTTRKYLICGGVGSTNSIVLNWKHQGRYENMLEEWQKIK